MDLNTAIEKHAEWKFKFRNALASNEQMDAAAIAKDTYCDVGKWLHGEAAELYGENPAHAKCLVEHAVFHIEAGKVARAVNARDINEVEEMLSSESAFSEASKRVGISIVELKNAIHA